MKRILTILSLIICSATMFGQQEIMISQYMFNGLVLNPAYSGSHPYWSGSILGREQWLGMDGRPRTQTLCIDGPIANRKFGVGLNLTNDMLGIVSMQDIGLNFSAKVNTARGTLAAGLRLSGSLYSTNTGRNDFQALDSQDPIYLENMNNVFVPKVGFGIYYNERKWFAGLSVPTIVSSDKKLTSDIIRDKDRFFKNHAYLNAGFVFEPTIAIAVKPSVLIKYTANTPVQADINCNVLFFRKFWLGAGYRTGAALVAMTEWNINPQLRIGLAYDYTASKLNTAAANSLEVMLGYDFGKEVDIKVRSPRYF